MTFLYRFGSGSSSQSIWLDNVDCSSFDSNLVDDCSHNTIGVNDCSHSDDIMINCGSSFIDATGSFVCKQSWVWVYYSLFIRSYVYVAWLIVHTISMTQEVVNNVMMCA